MQSAKEKKRSSQLIKKIKLRDKNICQCCGKKTQYIEVHHIDPLFMEGEDEENNMICLCSFCHRHAPSDPANFLEYQKTGGANWHRITGSALFELAKSTPNMTIEEFVRYSLLLKQTNFDR